MATSTSMSISGYVTSTNSAPWPAPWAPTRNGEKPISRRPARCRTRRTRSGRVRNSATANAARKPAGLGPPRRPTPRARYAPMGNGARPLPWTTPSPAAAICSTWNSCSWSTTKTNFNICSTASSSTAARVRSASRIWSAAIPTCRCGRTTTRNWIGRSATARYGLATIQAGPATMPPAWWSPRHWNPGRNSASWKNTAGEAIRSPTKPPRSKSLQSVSTCNTSGSTSLVWATACSTWCATSTRRPHRSTTALRLKTPWCSRPRTRSRAVASSGMPAGPISPRHS